MNDRPVPMLGEGAIGLALAIIVSAWGGSWVLVAVLLGWQSYTWLKTAVWPHISLSDGLAYVQIPPPHTDWAGIQRAIDTGLTWPLTSWLFGAPPCVALVLLILLSRFER